MALAAYVGLVQFLFGTTWTLYVVYLPQLAQAAGIGREWVPWILIADQLAFAAMDIVTGFWIDRVRAALGRFGVLVMAGSLLSAVAFLALPYAGTSASVLLVAIAIWAITSSALRSPPWALLARYAPTPRMPWLSTIVLTGTAVAGAIAPYLGIALRGVDARVPFVVSTLTLLAAVVALVIAEKRLPPNPPPEPKPAPPIAGPALFIALLLLTLGFQVHFSLSSAQRYVEFVPREWLPYLMPVFWIGFNLLMFPAAQMVKRLGSANAMALAAALGALAMLGAALAPNLALLLAAQFLGGGCWGAATVAAYSAAVALGRTGREGQFLGTLFAMLAVGVAARIALAGSGLAQASLFIALQPWLPQTLWLCGALVLLAGRRR
jgi:MFS family permease